MRRRNQLLRPSLMLSIAALALFAGLAASVKPNGEAARNNAVTELDRGLDQRLHELNDRSPKEVTIFSHITDLGSSNWILTLALAVALLLVAIPVFRFRRQRRAIDAVAQGSFLALVWMLILLGGQFFNQGLKEYFKRARPPYHEAAHATGYSFPSGHTMASFIAYGMIAYLLVLSIPARRLRITVVSLLAALVALIGFSRIFLGAHWLTDVLGGFAAGGFWLALCISAMEMVRRRRPALPTAPPAPVALQPEIAAAPEKVAT